jgi:hypothetical protein
MMKLFNVFAFFGSLSSVSALIHLKSKLKRASFDGGDILAIQLDESNGAFNITLNDAVWFGSMGKRITLRDGGKEYSVDDGSLYLDGVYTMQGRDAWGKFTEIQLTYKTSGTSSSSVKVMNGNIRSYATTSAITFEQVIVDALSDTSSGNSDSVVTRFPVFDIDSTIQIPDSSCLFTSWDEDFPSPVNSNWVSPTCREWSSKVSLPGGIAGTGPLLVWDESSAVSKNLNNGFFPTFVLSPMTNAMALSLDAGDTASPGQAAYGNKKGEREGCIN